MYHISPNFHVSPIYDLFLPNMNVFVIVLLDFNLKYYLDFIVSKGGSYQKIRYVFALNIKRIRKLILSKP